LHDLSKNEDGEENMKLKSLRLVNYRIHQDSTLDCGDATFVILRGRNMSGKTSFAEALSMNLANTTVSLPGDGKGFTKKISQNQQKAIITAEIQGTHLLRNTVTLQTNTSGRTVNTECLDDPDNNKIVNGFKNFLADRKAAILIATSTDYFSRLEEKAQTDLLAKLVLPAHYDFPKDKIEATNGFLDTPINFDAEPFEVITKAYKALYKERETINRQVKDFDIPGILPMPRGVDSETLQTQLTEIKAKRHNLQLERDTAVAKANEIEVKRVRLQTKIEGLRAELGKGKARLEHLETELLSAEQVQRFTATAAKATELSELNKSHSAYLGGMQVVNEQIGRLKQVSGMGATCPTCEQEINEAAIAKLIADLEKEYADADQKIQALDKQIEAIGDIGAAKESLRKHEAAVKEKITLEASLTETVKQGKATKAELEALPEASNATLPFNDPLATLQAQEERVNEQLRPVIAAEERASEIKRLTAQKEKLVAKAATLDTLVKFFDKDGVKKTLIEQYIGGFEDKLISVMDAWGYEASLSEDLRFEVVTKRGYSGPVKELSGAEDFIFKAAFQCAVSIAAGIKLVVIDEVEELGEDIRNALFVTVYDLIDKGLLDQAILIGYSLDKTIPPKEKRAPGSKYFFVTDGTVEELK
jgi:DNA repair exonuclease SbcCD ATPase subunit